jgi:hypothetical protein
VIGGVKRLKARPRQDASPESRRWRGHVTGASRCVFPFPLTFNLDTPCLPKPHLPLRKLTFPEPCRSGLSRIDHLYGGKHDEERSEHCAGSYSCDEEEIFERSYESRETKKVSKSMLASSPSEPRCDVVVLFAITHAEYDSSTSKNAQIERMLGGLTDVTAREGGIGVGVQEHTGMKGVIRDRAEAESRTKQEQSWDLSDLGKRMEGSALTGEDMERG